MPIPMQIWIDPVRHRGRSFRLRSPRRLVTDLRDLCRRAGIKVRYSGPLRRVVVYSGTMQIQTRNTDYVGVPIADLESRVAALRALEALAHSFFDHGARACVCHRGIFGPAMPERVVTQGAVTAAIPSERRPSRSSS